MKQTISFLILFALITMMQSCSSTKDVIREGKRLEVKRLAVQKIVPGMPNSSSYHQLTVQLAFSDSELILDSIYYQSKVYFFESTSTNELLLENSKPSTGMVYSEDAGSAVIFYHVARKSYYQIHDEIERLEDIYRP